MHHLFVAFLAALAAAPFVFGYTSSKAQTSQGTLLQVNPTNASPPVWVTVGEVVDMSFNDKNMFDDTTNTQSVAKEFLATLPDPGKLSCTVNRVSTDAGQAAIQASYHAQPPTRLQYQVLFPVNTAAGQSSTGDARQFLAYVESLSPDIKVDKKITSKFSLQITGGITEVEGA